MTDPVYVYRKGEGWVPVSEGVRPPNRKLPIPRQKAGDYDTYPLDWNAVCNTCDNELSSHFGYLNPNFGGIFCDPHRNPDRKWS